MSIPTKPYSTSAQVGLLIGNLLGKNNTDFNDNNTTPKKSAVDQYLIWISNQVDIQFQQAGYKIPFQIISGESWPEHQTYYLELLTAMGAAALAGGHVLKPAPAINSGRGFSTGNLYQDLFNIELRKIWNAVDKTSWIRFRAQTYSGTPAEYSITEPIGPNLDYMEGKLNPEQHLSFDGYTNLRHDIQTYVEDSGVMDWDDFHGLFNEKLLGYSYRG